QKQTINRLDETKDLKECNTRWTDSSRCSVLVNACSMALVCNSGPVQVDPSGELLLLAQGGCPWKEHLFALEKELKVDVLIKFVLYPDQSGHWRVQCVPAGLNTFQNRLSLLEEWRGVRDEALSELSGIPGCIFVHASGFIGGNRTQEGALEMAKRTLQTAPRAVPST
uniref:Myg1 exonuclease n=1 Tax=Sinocyclocheilus grahami TaxID=75366 RepID=A0A672MF51_SINGR